MNTKQMKAQLAKAKKNSDKPEVDDTSFLEGTAHILGSVPSATLGFFDAIGTSFKYHEAKRKQEL